MATTQITEQDVRLFQERLEEFGNSLPPKQQLILAQILVEASSGGDDVEGHMFGLEKYSWPVVRERLGTILDVVLEGFALTTPDIVGNLEYDGL